MNRLTAVACSIALTASTASRADSKDVQELASVTAAAVASISAKLTDYQRRSSAAAERRVLLIAVVERTAAERTLEVSRELEILKNSGGVDLVKMFVSLQEHGNRVAAEPAQVETAFASAVRDVQASYKPLSVSTDKIDAAAKGLASLGAPSSSKERFSFLKSYISETRKEIRELESAASESGDEADKSLGVATKSVTNSMAK